MASTNKTTNYDLSQFIETDKPGWLTDYNSDMRKLDTALKGVSDMASGASGSITDLANRMTNAEGNIITNANDIDALEARADSLEAQAQSQAGTISGIQTEQITQNAGIEAATELGYNLARPYDSASTYAVGDYVLFQNTLYKCVTAVPVGEAFVPAKWLAIKAMDEMNTGGYTLPIASASQLGGVKVGSGLSIDPDTGELTTSSTLPGYREYSSNEIVSISNARVAAGTAQAIACNFASAYSIGNILFLTLSFSLNGYQPAFSTPSTFALNLLADLQFTTIVNVPQDIKSISHYLGSAESSTSQAISIKNLSNSYPATINASGILRSSVIVTNEDGSALPSIRTYATFALPLVSS